MLLTSLRRLVKLTMVATAAAALGLPSAASAATSFDFEDQAFGADTPLVLTHSGFTATFASSADPGAFGITSAYGLYPLMTGNILLSPGSAFVDSVPLTISFSGAVTSISFVFGLGGAASGSSLSVTTDAGESFSFTGSVPVGSLLPQGLALITGTPFRQVTLTSNTLDFAIDDLSASPVPEPAAGVTLALGLIWLASRRLRTNLPC